MEESGGGLAAGDSSWEEVDGDLADEYVLGEELGAGGFSTVRLATHKRTGEQVAVKTLMKVKASRSQSEQKGVEAEDLTMIKNEVMIVSYLADHVDHPNVVSLVDIFDEDTKVHLVQELCKGGELFYRIELKLQEMHKEIRLQMQQQKSVQETALFSERDAADIVRQVASGLHELHEKGVIHRDMKPENLLYKTSSADSEIKITDFGLSHKEGTADPMQSKLLGSIDYIAPEVLTRRWYTKAGDMWSLGVITFILLSGSPPFGAHNTTAKLQKIIKCDYSFVHPVWSKISSAAKNLISQLLVLDAQKRFTCADILRHPWVTGACGYSDLHLVESLEGIKAFNAKRKFRAAALACIHIHRAKISKLHNTIASLGGSCAIEDDITSIHFSPQQLQELKTEFKRVCGKTTDIDFESFQRVMVSRLPPSATAHVASPASDPKGEGSSSCPPVLNRMFQLFDTNGDGAVDFREFIVGLGAMQAGAGEDRIKMCFKIYDVDDSGWISREELYDMLASMRLKNEMLTSFANSHADKKRKGGEEDIYITSTSPPAEQGSEGLHSAVVRSHSLLGDILGDLFERFDMNHDGKITYEEFKEGIHRDPFLMNVLFGPC